ncbi:MAG: c-type cytochrome [Chitinophagaceae bacterium]
MKKYFLTFAIASLIIACGNNSSNNNSSADSSAASTSSTADVTTNPDYKKGLALIAQSDCLTCHKISEKLTGPAYQDVANKYAGVDTAVTYLAHKVIAGGSGVWGTIPMTPHPQLSEADAEQMVKYILLLKTK